MRLPALLAALVVSSPLSAQSPSVAQRALRRAADAYARVRTLRADVEQTLTNPLTGSVTTQRATLVERRPGRVAVRFTAPAGDAVIADGKDLWVYTPSTAPGQVIRMRQSAAGAASVDPASAILTQPEKRFAAGDGGTTTVDGRPVHVVQLTPREDGMFTKAVVWVDDRDGLPRQFELTEASGLVRRVHLTHLQTNAPVDASAFAFTPPAGVRVVDQAAFGGR